MAWVTGAGMRGVLVRLKHPMAADEEFHDVLPSTLREFEAALARGELRALKVGMDQVVEVGGLPGKGS